MISKNILDPQERYRYLQVLLERPIAYHRIFAKIAGSVTAGLFLSQLFYWTPRGKDEDNWIYKTAKDWYEETALTRREQETARKLLKQKKLLQEKKCGVPCKLFYRINTEVLLELIAAQTYTESVVEGVEDTVQTRMAESAKLERRKAPNRNGGKRQTRTAESAKHSIYTETTSETTHIHSPPPPTQESVCKENSSGQEEAAEILSSSVAQKNEELKPHHQTLQKVKNSAAPIENENHTQYEHPAAKQERWMKGDSKKPDWAIHRRGCRWIAKPEFIEWYAKSREKDIEFAANLLQKPQNEDTTQLLWKEYQASLRPSQPLTAPSYTIRKPPSPEEKAAEQKEKLLRRIRNTPKGNKRLIPDCLPELVRSGEIPLSKVPQWMQEVMEF
ncbi:MAG: hypothetical protein F6K14_11705 [Symploca sp. SIO2C1]|nr:hypothetical protein [Symploca sp. SIO2C1]